LIQENRIVADAELGVSADKNFRGRLEKRLDIFDRLTKKARPKVRRARDDRKFLEKLALVIEGHRASDSRIFFWRLKGQFQVFLGLYKFCFRNFDNWNLYEPAGPPDESANRPINVYTLAEDFHRGLTNLDPDKYLDMSCQEVRPLIIEFLITKYWAKPRRRHYKDFIVELKGKMSHRRACEKLVSTVTGNILQQAFERISDLNGPKVKVQRIGVLL
jgi:hypothetical protein